MTRAFPFPARLPAAELRLALLLFASAAAPLSADDLLARYDGRTTVHVLDNGWTFVIVEQDGPPIAAVATVAGVGSVHEVPGITGVAHLIEHLAFKGTSRIGALDGAAEEAALAALEEAYSSLLRELRRRPQDAGRIEESRRVFEALQERAASLADSGRLAAIIEREGGVGLNAATERDYTVFTYALPANKLELFAHLESERFADPVFRDLYKEREVVNEERRQRVENRALGKLIEQCLAVAFTAHPYGQPVLGHPSDLEALTPADVAAFFRRYYVPSNLVTAIVGNVRSETVIPLLEEYFGAIPGGAEPPLLRTQEPPSLSEKTIVLYDEAQPLYAEMYHRPGVGHPDDAVFVAIDDILSSGRTSRLYRVLVRDQQLAAFVDSFTPFPGLRFANLLLVVAIPNRDRSVAELRTAIRAELSRLREEPVTAAELVRFRTRARADLFRRLRDDQGLARELAVHQTLHGDWRELFRSLSRYDAVTAEDVQRVARTTFLPSNRTSGTVVTHQGTAPGSE
jgi:predicted Zn-dependent peptidase